MAEIKTRPEATTFQVEVEDDAGVRTVEALNLDDVLRAILWDRKVSRNLTTSSLAPQVGLKRSTLSTILDQENKGLRLSTLATICAALGMTAVELLQQHEALSGPSATQESTAITSGLLTQLEDVLTVTQARSLLDLMLKAHAAGIPEEWIAIGRVLFDNRGSSLIQLFLQFQRAGILTEWIAKNSEMLDVEADILPSYKEAPPGSICAAGRWFHPGTKDYEQMKRLLCAAKPELEDDFDL